jgi:hypothetical protein
VITPQQLAQKFNDASAQNFPQIQVKMPK